MNKLQVLVTGATGKTGRPVVEMLCEKGVAVRAFVKQVDERSDELKAMGAEIVVGNFHDISTVRNAMENVNKVYFCYPPADGLLEAATHVAISARDTGVESLVNMSQISAREITDSPLAHQHWLTEQLFDWADIGATHIRPTFFAEDIYIFTGGSIGREAKIYLPFGQGKHAPIAASDIARVVVGILLDPKPHIGKHYVLTGSINMSVSEMADIISEIIGMQVEYIDIPIDAWKRALVEQEGFPEFLATHLAAVAQDHHDGIFSAETDIVKRIGGKNPVSYQDFIKENIDQIIG